MISKINIKKKDLISKEIKKKLDNLSESGRWSEYKNYKYNLDVFFKLYHKKIKNKKISNILDFGCGATWCEFVLKQFNINVTSLDLNDDEVISGFKNYHSILGTKVIYYDGVNVPFKTNEFHAILFKASIMKLNENQLNEVIPQLIKSSCQKSYWFIGPYFMYYNFLNYVNSKNNIFQKLKSKEIEIVPFTWNPLEFNNRSKKIYYEIPLFYKFYKIYKKIF